MPKVHIRRRNLQYTVTDGWNEYLALEVIVLYRLNSIEHEISYVM